MTDTANHALADDDEPPWSGPPWGPDLPTDGGAFTVEMWQSRWPGGNPRVELMDGALYIHPAHGPYDERDAELAARVFPLHEVGLENGTLIVRPLADFERILRTEGRVLRLEAVRTGVPYDPETVWDRIGERLSAQAFAQLSAARFDQLIDESSLGSEQAKAIRGRAHAQAREHVKKIMLAMLGRRMVLDESHSLVLEPVSADPSDEFLLLLEDATHPKLPPATYLIEVGNLRRCAKGARELAGALLKAAGQMEELA